MMPDQLHRMHKARRIVIQIAIMLTFVFGLLVGYIAYSVDNLIMGLIFISTLQLIVLLSLLYMTEKISETIEAKR